MFKKIMNRLNPPVIEKEPSIKKRNGYSDAVIDNSINTELSLDEINQKIFQRTSADFRINGNIAMDAASISEAKNLFGLSGDRIPLAQLQYFAEHSFIGYQLCAILAQHWLIDKACTLPGEDAIRNGYDITYNNVDEENQALIKEEIEKLDTQFKLTENLVELIRMGRTFGIRLLLFEVKSTDPNYYRNPFNIDGVLPGSYKGMTQIDPFWITPELDFESASNPRSKNFYEPTWWRVNGELIHRSHFVIMRTNTVADILKPTYYYGGVPIPQQIYYRVYSAERTANEAPELTLTKRLTWINTDIAKAVARPAAFKNRMDLVTQTRNNYGMFIMDVEDKAGQFDTTLADLDAVIMTQYQLVASAAKVPADKLLGTSPKGFNTTGEYEQKSYHEYLKNIQTHYLTPALNRHYLLLIKSHITPEFKIPDFTIKPVWRPLNEMTAKEKAELNKLNADTGAVLIADGAIDASDERNRIINDPSSGYDGLEPFAEEENNFESLLNELEAEENAETDII